MPVLNPDGYQYTFDHERLWRKNLRDNNGDGRHPGRRRRRPEPQLPSHWGYDNEGSSPIPSSDTYRGPAPASEPETRAVDPAVQEGSRRVHGQLPLQRPAGCSTTTAGRSAPRPRTTRSTTPSPATSTTRRSRTSTRASPRTSSTSPTARSTGTPRRPPAPSPGRRSSLPGCPTCGFVFPDDEALVQAEFERNLPFARSVAASRPRTPTTRSRRSASRPSPSTSTATTPTRPASRPSS